jgi:hypothetical protein
MLQLKLLVFPRLPLLLLLLRGARAPIKQLLVLCLSTMW